MATTPRAHGWARRVLGLLGAGPFPAFGYAFPWAAPLAVIMLVTHRAVAWPRYTRALIFVAGAGALAFLVSALLQGKDTSVLMLHYIAFALFVAVGVNLTAGTITAGQLVAYAAAGTVGFYVFIGTELASGTFEHLWKYGIGVPVTFVAMWLAVRANTGRIAPVLVLAAIGALSMYLGFRSHGLVCVIAIIIIMVKGRSRRRLAWKIGLSGVGLYLLGVLLPNAISAGVFGVDVQRRTLEQTAAGASPLLAGRVEPPLSLSAIAEKPFLGWADVQTIDTQTFQQGARLAQDLGLRPDHFMDIWVRDDGRVALHSHLLEGWATGGIVAAVLPALVLMLLVTALIRSHGQFSPMVVLVAAQGSWDVLFSPWGYNQAFLLAFNVVLCAWAITAARHVPKNVRPSDGHARVLAAAAGSR